MARRSSTTQLAELNAALLSQNQQLQITTKVAQQTLSTQNNIQGELYRQRGVIQNNIDRNKEIKTELYKANKKTNQMRRRNFCTKLMLWIVLILLFAANIGLVIWKLT